MFRHHRNKISRALALAARSSAMGAVLALSSAIFFAPALAQEGGREDARADLALMGTIPIYWGEAVGFGDLLNRDGDTHWARLVIERDYRIAPLDYLSEEALAPHLYLLLAQPRGLSPEENVALDNWVRAGGRLLLFADPMMTGESRFALGDRRRPQDVSLLSPILAHWGLELQFDEAQNASISTPEVLGQAYPVNLPGRLVSLPGGECVIEADGLVTSCALGLGEAIIVADAAILDFAGPYTGAESGLMRIMAHIFADSRENAGQASLMIDPDNKNGGIARFSASVALERGGHSPP